MQLVRPNLVTKFKCGSVSMKTGSINSSILLISIMLKFMQNIASIAMKMDKVNNQMKVTMPAHPLFFLDVVLVKASLLFEIFSTAPPPLTSKDFLVTSLLSKPNFLKDTFYFSFKLLVK